jgi:hypothetical protein
MSLLKDLKVSRRFALRGALGGIGVAMWLPVLDAMCNNNGTAFAAGQALPTSFGIWFWGNGVHTELWTPEATGSGDAWQLKENLLDFADVKDAMTLVTGLDMLSAQFKGHGWGVCYVLSGGDGNICNTMADLNNLGGHQFETAQQTQWIPTLDQVIADALEDEAIAAGIKPPPFKSFETGMIPFTGDYAMGTVGSNIAHRGPNNVLPPKRSAKEIFDALFSADLPTPPTGSGGSGGSGSTGVPSDISFKLRCSALDAVSEDLKRLKMTLGAEDALRVESHVEGIRALEGRLPECDAPVGTGGGTGGTGATPTAACTKPVAPPETIEDMTERSQAINQLIVTALSCNLTRVYSHLWSGARSDSNYPTLNLNGGHHAYTHGSDGQEPRDIERYIMSQYADLAKRMKATPMGAGTVLDNTLIYGVSEQGTDPKNHFMKDYHMVLMGHAGGKLPGNRHIRLPGRKVTELMLTMQQVMGLPVTEYGTWDPTNKTIPDILA